MPPDFVPFAPMHTENLRSSPEFIKGYYYAVATLLSMGNGSDTQEPFDLFNWGPNAAIAEDVDKVVFRRLGLLK